MEVFVGFTQALQRGIQMFDWDLPAQYNPGKLLCAFLRKSLELRPISSMLGQSEHIR